MKKSADIHPDNTFPSVHITFTHFEQLHVIRTDRREPDAEMEMWLASCPDFRETSEFPVGNTNTMTVTDADDTSGAK